MPLEEFLLVILACLLLVDLCLEVDWVRRRLLLLFNDPE
jgi:hypothetical protein